ncbi:MAG TPA: hypothetical protein VN702_07630 [Acetobacteraceae bacterium]|nr:hypothetical protein [Acetobacteraceae bacterium]
MMIALACLVVVGGIAATGCAHRFPMHAAVVSRLGGLAFIAGLILLMFAAPVIL